ncbi:MAG: hypothetical protein AB9866_00060 [Syntrophobacteraceae bacterium]
MSEELWMRCPRLGGEVPLSYCLKEGGSLPCARTLACWQPIFPIEVYLSKKLTQREWDECFNRQTKSKVVSLIELIEEAKGGNL